MNVLLHTFISVVRDIARPAFFLSIMIGAVSLAQAASENSASLMSLGDIQIGERGNQTRIAFVCHGECFLSKREGGRYHLSGATASIQVDLASRSDRLSSIVLTPTSEGDGSLLQVNVGEVLESSLVSSCTVGRRKAACLDLFFLAPGLSARKDALSETANMSQIASEQGEHVNNEERLAAAPPPLRESATERYDALKALGEPQRLNPPSGAILAKVQPIEETVEIARPSMREPGALAQTVKGDFAARVTVMLSKELSPAYCNNAEAALKSDAWALGAMVDVGLCVAARGQAAEADEMLARLLAFTPDNFEALVGRALIAELAEEKGVARKYYQEALDTLPPFDESKRILDAMGALK